MLDTVRLGRVAVALPDGRRKIGTCYAITENLVLTAAHVALAAGPSGQVQIRFLKNDRGWEPARIAWHDEGEMDAALLQLESPRCDCRPVLFGVIRIKLRCHLEGLDRLVDLPQP